MDGWASPKKAAAYMSIKERTLRELLKQGLPCIRLSRKTILIRYQELDTWLIKRFGSKGEIADRIADSFGGEE
jgi:excisionase family DNA binding protein